MRPQSATKALASDWLFLWGVASIVLVVHFVTGNGYGFHRDELQFLDDARHLDFGFVAYPPLTSFLGRVAIALFGISPQVFRLPAALLNMASLVTTGLIARELGGGRLAQVTAMLASLPVALVLASVLQYTSTDYLAWASMALCVAKVLGTEDERWWIGVGAAAGMGILSKYSIAFPLLSLVAALAALPTQRRHLRSRWFWMGAGTMLLVASPNLVWLLRHHFITLTMEQSIHARDVAHGRAAGYWTDQLKFTLLGLPIAVAGLVWLLRNARFRLLSAFYLGPLLLFALVKGRGYYLLPGYVVLYAAGAVAFDGWAGERGHRLRMGLQVVVFAGLVADTILVAGAALPIAPPQSHWWRWQMANYNDLPDEVGWPELVATVARVRDGLSPKEREHLAILTDNYGEAGALALYGPRHGLPTPIATVNSFYDRGYGSFEPENVIVVGESYRSLSREFESCRVGATMSMPYGVKNEESTDAPVIYVCHHLLGSWAEVWAKNRHFG